MEEFHDTECVDWTKLAQDRIQQQNFVNTVMKCGGSMTGGISLHCFTT